MAKRPDEGTEQNEDGATTNDLVFPIPIVGVRWRVRGVEGVSDRWTRETVFLQRDGIAIGQSVVEIQFLVDPISTTTTDLTRDEDVPDRTVAKQWFFQLASVGDCLEVSIESLPFLAVMRSDHPIVESETVELTEGGLAFSCKVVQNVKEISVIVKDPFDSDRMNEPIHFSLAAMVVGRGKVSARNFRTQKLLGSRLSRSTSRLFQAKRKR